MAAPPAGRPGPPAGHRPIPLGWPTWPAAPGWAAIELAKAFPHLTVDGRDNDEASSRSGGKHAVEPRASPIGWTLEVVDLADESADWSPRYDLAMLFECVHDFPRPVEVAAARSRRRPARRYGPGRGRCERPRPSPRLATSSSASSPSASAIWCLPQGRVGPDPEPVGTLIRPADMRDLARAGGLRRRADPADRAPGLAVLPAGPVTAPPDRAARRDRDRHVLGAGPALHGRCWTARAPASSSPPAGTGRTSTWPRSCATHASGLRRASRRRSRGPGSAAVEHFGQVDILVNNAGIAHSGPAEEESAEHCRTSSTPTSPGCSDSPSWSVGTCWPGAAEGSPGASCRTLRPLDGPGTRRRCPPVLARR